MGRCLAQAGNAVKQRRDLCGCGAKPTLFMIVLSSASPALTARVTSPFWLSISLPSCHTQVGNARAPQRRHAGMWLPGCLVCLTAGKHRGQTRGSHLACSVVQCGCTVVADHPDCASSHTGCSRGSEGVFRVTFSAGSRSKVSPPPGDGLICRLGGEFRYSSPSRRCISWAEIPPSIL